MVMSPGLYENAASSSEIPAVPSGGAFGVLGGQLSEVLAGVDPPLEVEGLVVCVHEDVGATCLSNHGGRIGIALLSFWGCIGILIYRYNDTCVWATHWNP